MNLILGEYDGGRLHEEGFFSFLSLLLCKLFLITYVDA